MTVLEELCRKRGLGKGELCRLTGLPWATVSDLWSGKTTIANSRTITAYRLAQALEISLEELLSLSGELRTSSPEISFDMIRSTVKHEVKRKGEIPFLIEIIGSDRIRREQDERVALYLTCMTDYLSRKNGIPLCREYDDIRSKKLRKPLYPSSAWVPYFTGKDTSALRKCRKNAIPEFAAHNIFEGDIEDVI